MSEKYATRRNVLKTLGATATAATAASLPVSASTVDYPVVYISQNVYNNYTRYDVMKPVSSLLLDALPYEVASSVSLSSQYPDVSTASSLDEAHSQFKTFLDNSADYPSNETNVFVVDETKFSSDTVEADALGGNATTVAGAKHFQEHYREHGVPGQYGESEAYRRFWNMLGGVGGNYDVSYGQGRTYKDSSVTDDYSHDYIRTPMATIWDDDNGQGTNSCGQDTYQNNYIAVKELRYTDCSLDTIRANGS